MPKRVTTQAHIETLLNLQTSLRPLSDAPHGGGRIGAGARPPARRLLSATASAGSAGVDSIVAGEAADDAEAARRALPLFAPQGGKHTAAASFAASTVPYATQFVMGQWVHAPWSKVGDDALATAAGAVVPLACWDDGVGGLRARVGVYSLKWKFGREPEAQAPASGCGAAGAGPGMRQPPHMYGQPQQRQPSGGRSGYDGGYQAQDDSQAQQHRQWPRPEWMAEGLQQALKAWAESEVAPRATGAGGAAAAAPAGLTGFAALWRMAVARNREWLRATASARSSSGS
jgi:hypothetical protein